MKKRRKTFVLIPLSRSLVTAISPEDEKRVREHTWFAREGYKRHKTFYAATYIKGKLVFLHRFLLKPPRNKETDHWNGETLDNRPRNLRVCTHSQNLAASRKTTGTSKYRGVGWNSEKRKWEVRTQHKGKKYFIGYFKNEKTAAKAYDIMVRKLKGKFAGTNFPLPNERPPKPPKVIRAQRATTPTHYAQKRGPETTVYVGVFHTKSGQRKKRFYFELMYKRKRYRGSHFYFKTAKQAALARDNLIIKNGWPHPLNFPKRKRRK